MLAVARSPVSLFGRGHDEIPQTPLERLYPLKIDIVLRRNTFSEWPRDVPVSPGNLCDNGFYYMGMKDKVQCVFCGGVLSDWRQGDDVQQEHARHFGKCELVRLKRFEFSRKSQKTESTSRDSDVKPHDSRYSLYSDRLLSFKSWPSNTAQRPEDLAANGLYYKGTEDKCQCYMCGGILSGWENEDVPKEEHKKWFPKCPLHV